METSITDILGAPVDLNAATAQNKSNELGQDEFMRLMLTQLRYQDPLKPVDNTEFIAQTAQFSSVAGINSMRDSLDKFIEEQGTIKSLYSAGLLGKTAMIRSSEVTLQDNEPVEIEFSLPQQAGFTNALFLDQSGAVVQTKTLGARGSGDHVFSWEGSGDTGESLPPGTYSIRIEYPDAGGEVSAADISIASRIESVVFGSGSTAAVLNTSDGHSVTLADISKIKK